MTTLPWWREKVMVYYYYFYDYYFRLVSLLFFPCESVWKTFVLELHISYSHTDMYLLFFRNDLVLQLAEASVKNYRTMVCDLVIYHQYSYSTLIKVHAFKPDIYGIVSVKFCYLEEDVTLY